MARGRYNPQAPLIGLSITERACVTQQLIQKLQCGIHSTAQHIRDGNYHEDQKRHSQQQIFMAYDAISIVDNSLINQNHKVAT